MTKVLVLSLFYPPHHFGGYEVSCRDVMDRLRDRGHDITVLTADLRVPGVADPAGERESGVRRDLRAYYRDDDVHSPPVPARWRYERHNQRALRAVLDEVRPDVVSVWQMGAMSLGLLTTVAERGVPLVYAVSDDWLSYGVVLDAWSRLFVGPRRERFGRLLRPVLGVPTVLTDVGASGTFCFISDSTRERAEEYSPWSFPDWALVYSGIDTSLFPTRPADAGRSWRGRLLYVGRYDPRKGIETLVRAVPSMAEGTVVEVQGTGDASYRDHLADLAARLGVADRVEFGAVTRAELAARYAAADAVVFPSEWEEPFGLVPLEAMACGVPVVATGVGGSGEFLLDGHNCVRFEAGDPGGLAAAVERLAGDGALRDRLVANGLRTAAYFDIEHLADAFEAWHDWAAGHGSGERPAGRRFTPEGRPADG